MKKSNLNLALLAGTALIAAGSFATSAHAVDLTGDTTLSGDVATAPYDLKGFDLTVDDSQTNALNAITDTTTDPADADGNVVFTAAGASEGTGLTLTVDSIDLGTVGDVSVIANDQDATGEDSTAITVTGNLSAANILVQVDATTPNAADDALLAVGGNITATAIVLDDAAGAGNTATLELNGTANQLITGTINGGAADEGVLIVNNSAGTVTFASAVGTTALSQITITDATETVFQNTVGATAMTVAAEKDVEFQNDATIGTLTLADSATTEIQFAGSSAQTFTGDIAGSAGGSDGIINVDNTTTFAGVIGAANSVAALDVATGQTATLATTGTANGIDTTTLNGTAVFVYDSTNAGADTVLTGDVVAAADGNGTIRVTGAQTARIAGNIGANGADIGALEVTNLANGDAADFAGNVYANSIAVDAADDAHVNTVILGNGVGDTVEITGNITAAENNVHVLEFDAGASSYVSGNIGDATNTFATVTLSQSIDLQGNVYAATIDGSGDLELGGSAAQTVSGAVSSTGDITVSNAAGVTFLGAISGAVNATVSGAATYNENATFTTTYTNTGGTTTVAAGKILTAASFTDDGSYVLQASGSDIGVLTDSDAGGETLTLSNVSIDVTGDMDTSASIDNVLNSFAAFTPGAISDNSALYSFAVNADGDVTASLVDTATLTQSKATKAAADQLLSVGSAATGNLGTIIDNLAAAGSAEAADDVVEATTSDVAGGGAIAALTVSNQTATATNARLAALRTGETGMAAGNHGEGLKTWGQAFGTTAEQDERDGVQGYDADTIGFAAGVDTENLIDGGIVGLAFSYANTEVESDAADSAETDVDSYQVTLYGDYDIDANTFVSAQLGYAWSKNDTTRKNVGGISGVTATGDYDADQFSVRTEVGRDYDVDGITVTPSVLANYVHYSADTYTETGAGTANLTVDAEDLNVFELGLGVDVSQTHEYADGSAFKPVLSLGVRHDLVGDEFEANNTFAGGGSAFKVEGFDPAQTTFNAGVAGTYFADENWEVTAEYDYEFKSDYSAHSGLVKAAYKFQDLQLDKNTIKPAEKRAFLRPETSGRAGAAYNQGHKKTRKIQCMLFI